MNVHRRCEQHTRSLRPGIFAQRFANTRDQVRVPAGGKHYAYREARRGKIATREAATISSPVRTVAHLYGGDVQALDRCGIPHACAPQQRHPLFKRHLSQKGPDARFGIRYGQNILPGSQGLSFIGRYPAYSSGVVL